MNRTLFTDLIPSIPDNITPRSLVITPHTAAAEALGVRKTMMFDLGREHLQNAGLSVASEFESFEFLKQAIAKIDPGYDPAALAARIRTILRTMLRTGINADELASRGSEQVKQLALIAREYERLLGEHSLVDNSAVLWRAANLRPEPRTLYIYGYFRARKEEIVFINAFAGDGSVYHLPCGTDQIFHINNMSADYLETVGKWTISKNSKLSVDLGGRAAQSFVEPKDDPCLRAFSFHNLESEIRFVLGKIKRMLVAGAHVDDIAMVARDLETYAPVISEVSQEYGLPTDIRSKLPIDRTLFGSFVECLLTANEKEFEFDSAASLLMHPFGPGLKAEDWKAARKNRIDGPDLWSKLFADLECLVWRSEATWPEWIECLSDTFAKFDVRRRTSAITREILAYNAFVDAISSLHPAGTISRFDLFKIVREVMASTRVPFQPSSGGIAVYDLDGIQGAKFRHLFIVGMAEGVLPPPVSDNAVIDFYERAQLAPYGIEFEEAAEVARWSALSFFFTLVAASESITLTVPAAIGDSHKIKSPYLERLGISDPEPGEQTEISSLQEELRILLRSDTTAGGILDRARNQLRVEVFRESVEAADEYDGVIGVPLDATKLSWSASQFTVLGQCPYKWFAQKVLALKPAEEAELSLSPSVRGKLYHKTLELAVHRARNARDLRKGILEVLDECFVTAESDEEVGLPKLENWHLQRGEHLTSLKKAVLSPDFIEEGAAVLSFEEEFDAVWNDLRIRGRIDRVDRTADGLMAIDYKTSSTPPHGAKNETGKSNVDVQLALYSQVALAHLYPGEPVAKGVYYSLTKGKVLKSLPSEKMPSLAELVTRMRALVSEGRFAVDPDVDGNACKYCDFDAMCRKGTRLSRKTKS